MTNKETEYCDTCDTEVDKEELNYFEESFSSPECYSCNDCMNNALNNLR